jgi:hypothetical protein
VAPVVLSFHCVTLGGTANPALAQASATPQMVVMVGIFISMVSGDFYEVAAAEFGAALRGCTGSCN